MATIDEFLDSYESSGGNKQQSAVDTNIDSFLDEHTPEKPSGPTFDQGGPPHRVINYEQRVKDFANDIGINIDLDAEGASPFKRFMYKANPNLTDINEIYRAENPQGKVEQVNIPDVGEVLIAQPEPGEDWRLINLLGVDPGDFGELAEDLPALGAELAMMHPALRSAKWGWQALKEGGAGLGARLATDAAQKLQGYEGDVTGSMHQSLLDTMMLGTAGAIGSMVNRGRGITPENQGLQDIAKAAEDLNVQLPPTAYSKSALLNRMWAQITATWGGAKNVPVVAKQRVSEILDNMTNFPEGGKVVGGKTTKTPTQIVGQEIKGQAKSLIEKRYSIARGKVRSAARLQGRELSPEEAGQEVQAGLKRYYNQTRNKRDELYNKAYNEIGELDVAISDSTRNVAQDIVDGIKGYVDEGGQIGTIVPGAKEGDVMGEVYNIAKSIVEKPGQQPLETVKQLRTALYDARELAAFSHVTKGQRKANDLWNALTDDITQSIEQKSPKALEKWKQANNYNTFREGQLKKKFAIEASNTQTPHTWVMNFLSNPDPAVMKSLQEMAPESLDKLSNAYFSHLTRNPDDILEWTKRLEQTGNYKALVTDKQLEVLKDLGQTHRALSSHPYRTILDQNLEAGFVMGELLKGKVGPERVREYIQDMGGKGSPGHEMLKAGFIDYLALKSFRRTEDGFLIDPKEFNRQLAQFDNKETAGMLEELFDPVDRAKLKNIEAINTALMSSRADPGASLEAAQSLTQLKGAFGMDPMGALRGAHDLMVNRTLGMLMLSPSMNKFLIGEAKRAKPKSVQWLKALAVASDDAKTIIDEHMLSNAEKQPPPPPREQIERFR